MADQELQVYNKAEVSPDRGELTHEGTYFTPAVDIYETEQELVLLADMPGVDAANLDIDLKDDTLATIQKRASFINERALSRHTVDKGIETRHAYS